VLSVLSVCVLNDNLSKMTNETNQGRPKRVRTQEPSQESSKNEKKPAPKSGLRAPARAADDALAQHVESLPDRLQPIALHHGRKIIECHGR